MLNAKEIAYLQAVIGMSAHPGSYRYLCDTGSWCFLAHQPVGHVIHEFRPL